MDPLDLRAIIEDGSRSATPALLEMLGHLDEADEWEDLRAALVAVKDPRSVEPLKAMALDRDRVDVQRRIAAEVLVGEALVPAGGRWAREAWQQGPPIQEVASGALSGAMAGEVLQFFAVPDRVHWIPRTTDWDGVRSEEFAAAWEHLLSSPAPRARQAAVDAVLWNEPYCLAASLRSCLEDPDDGVVDLAAQALEYFPSVDTLLALDAHDDRWRSVFTGSGGPAEWVRWSLDAPVRLASGTTAEEHIRGWISPVVHLLRSEVDQEDDDEEAVGPGPSSPRPTTPLDPRLEQWLDNPDAPAIPLHDAMGHKTDVMGVAAGDRRRWARRFVDHPDPVVRSSSARWLAEWCDADALLALAADPIYWVRKSAIYHLGAQERSEAVARIGWGAATDPNGTGAGRSEAVATWFTHAAVETRGEGLRELRQAEFLSVRCKSLELLGSSRDLGGVAPTWVPRRGESLAEVLYWFRACVAAGWETEPPAETWGLDDAHIKEALVRGVRSGAWGAL